MSTTKEKETKHIAVSISGEVSFIYDEELEALEKSGASSTSRASNVEPEGDGTWTADFSPIGHNVRLTGFKKRSEALAAEKQWLEDNIL